MRTFLKAAAIVAMIAVPTVGFAQAKKSTAAHEKAPFDGGVGVMGRSKEVRDILTRRRLSAW